MEGGGGSVWAPAEAWSQFTLSLETLQVQATSIILSARPSRSLLYGIVFV